MPIKITPIPAGTTCALCHIALAPYDRDAALLDDKIVHASCKKALTARRPPENQPTHVRIA